MSEVRRITDTKPTMSDVLLTPRELAKRWSTKVQVLSNWRSQGRGPRYYKMFNGQVRYPDWAVFSAEMGVPE